MFSTTWALSLTTKPSPAQLSQICSEGDAHCGYHCKQFLPLTHELHTSCFLSKLCSGQSSFRAVITFIQQYYQHYHGLEEGVPVQGSWKEMMLRCLPAHSVWPFCALVTAEQSSEVCTSCESRTHKCKLCWAHKIGLTAIRAASAHPFSSSWPLGWLKCSPNCTSLADIWVLQHKGAEMEIPAAPCSPGCRAQPFTEPQVPNLSWG